MRRRADRRGARVPRAAPGFARRPFNHGPALLIASAFFALIHFRPVEYPGLFVVGLVFGACVLLTGRLGLAFAAHMAFNVTGLMLAFDDLRDRSQLR